jgi:hypothetical protein
MFQMDQHHAVHGSLGHDRLQARHWAQDGHNMPGIGMEQSGILLVVLRWDLGNDVRYGRLD